MYRLLELLFLHIVWLQKIQYLVRTLHPHDLSEWSEGLHCRQSTNLYLKLKIEIKVIRKKRMQIHYIAIICIGEKKLRLPISPPAHKCLTEWIFLKNLKFDLHSSMGTIGTTSFCMIFACAPMRLKSPTSLWSLLFLPHPATNNSHSLGNCNKSRLS